MNSMTSIGKKFTQFLLTGALFLIPFNKADAYGIETHFYETETMLIFSGLHPAVAEGFATSAQWVDVSLFNSAMNPVLGMHARVSRLMHFPTEGFSPLSALINKIKSSPESAAHGDMSKAFSVAQRDSMIANEIFNEALKTGNRFLIGAALHVLMDSYAHEGFHYVIGHGDRGHYPDRPWMFLEKHQEMRKLLFKAMARIREVLPENALTSIQINEFGKPNKDLSPKELFEAYSKNPIIKEMDDFIPHRDPLYTAEAINLVLLKMEKDGISTAALRPYVFDQLRDLFFDKVVGGKPRDGWEIVTEIVHHLAALEPEVRETFVDYKKVMELYGDIKEEIIVEGRNGKSVIIRGEEIAAGLDIDNVLKEMVYELSIRVIPKPALGDADSQVGAKVSFENVHLYSKVEVPIQIAKWQTVKKRLFGLAPSELNREKLISKIFAYLNRDIRTLLTDIEKMEGGIKRVTMTYGDRARFMWTLCKYIVVDYATFRLTWPLVKMGLMKKEWGNLRLIDGNVPDAKIWQTDLTFKKMKDAGIFQMIFNAKQVDKLIAKWERKDKAFAKHLRTLANADSLTPEALLNQRRDAFLEVADGPTSRANRPVVIPVNAAIMRCNQVYAN